MSSYCIRIAKVKINIVSAGSSLDCSCPLLYSIVSIHFVSGQRSWSDGMMIKCWDNGITSCRILPQNTRKKREKLDTYWHLTILVPKFQYGQLLPVDVSKIARWMIFSNGSNQALRSALGPHCFAHISKTYLYNFDPLKRHFYIVKLGFTGVFIIFYISVQNIYCRYSLEPSRWGGSNEYQQSMFCPRRF